MNRPVRASVFATLIISLFGVTISVADPLPDSDEDQLRYIILAVKSGWENADGGPFYQHYLNQNGARFIESGGQNIGLKDLVEHHVEPEGTVLESLDLTFSNIETHIEGDFAWAVADIDVTATVKEDGRAIHNRGHETFLFRRVGTEWKVVHTHSSTRAVCGR